MPLERDLIKFFGVLEYWSDGVVEKLDYSFL